MLSVSPGFFRAPPKQSRVLVSRVSPGRNAATGLAGPNTDFTFSVVARYVTTRHQHSRLLRRSPKKTGRHAQHGEDGQPSDRTLLHRECPTGRYAGVEIPG